MISNKILCFISKWIKIKQKLHRPLESKLTETKINLLKDACISKLNISRTILSYWNPLSQSQCIHVIKLQNSIAKSKCILESFQIQEGY